MSMKIYVVPHTHVDIEWYWNVSDIRKILPKLFYDTAIKTLYEDPKMTFAQDQTLLIDMMLTDAAEEQRAFFKKCVSGGRVELTGGDYVQPELQEPCGEALISQIRVGQKWLKENFDTISKTAWFVDSFGQINQLPQILNQCGFKYYVFMRDVDERDDPDHYPMDYVLEGPDGTKMITHWLKDTYVLREHKNGEVLLQYNGLSITKENQNEMLRRFFDRELGPDTVAAKTGIALILWGDDLYENRKDTNEIKSLLLRAADKAGFDLSEDDITFSTPEKYFYELEKSAELLPIKSSDYGTPKYLQDLRGTFIARIDMKLANRLAEQQLLSLEALSAAVDSYYPQMDELWKPVLFNQFHDLMGGSCLDESRKQVLDRYASVINEAGTIKEKMLSNGSTAGKLLVFNPTQFVRDESVRVSKDGTEYAVGIKNIGPFEIREIAGDGLLKISEKQLSSNTIENGYYAVTFNPGTGDIVDILDKISGNHLLKGKGNSLCFHEEEDPDMEGRLCLTGSQITEDDIAADSFEVSDGPGYVKAICSKRFHGFTVVKTVTLHDTVKRVDFKLDVIDFPGYDGIMSVDFDFDMKDPIGIRETPFATENSNDGFYCAQKWAGLRDEGYQVSLINKGTCGYFINDNSVKMALLRGYMHYTTYYEYGTARDFEIFNDGRTHTEEACEKGNHTFEYSLYSDNKDLEYTAAKSSVEFNAPIEVICGGADFEPHKLIRAVDGTFVITRMYIDEYRNVIIRGYNANDKESACSISFFERPQRIKKVNMLDEELEDVQWQGDALNFEVGKHQIVTFKITF